jgi:hypothetical protein
VGAEVLFAASGWQTGQEGLVILQRKRVLQWLQEGSRRWKTGRTGPAQLLQEGSRQVKEVMWSIGSLQAG